MNWINGQLIFKSWLCPKQWSIYFLKSPVVLWCTLHPLVGQI
jgi:hypothetical protein